MILPHVLPLFVAWLATMLTLWIEHVALSRPPWRLGPPATYRVGVLTIIGGYLLWIGLEVAQGMRQIDIWIALVALVVIGPGAGVIVEVLYWYDARRGQSATRQGELVGSARDILNELRGRGTDEQSRRN